MKIIFKVFSAIFPQVVIKFAFKICWEQILALTIHQMLKKFKTKSISKALALEQGQRGSLDP